MRFRPIVQLIHTARVKNIGKSGAWLVSSRICRARAALLHPLGSSQGRGIVKRLFLHSLSTFTPPLLFLPVSAGRKRSISTRQALHLTTACQLHE